MADSLIQLARRIARLEKETRASSTQPQLAHSSVENGAIRVYEDMFEPGPTPQEPVVVPVQTMQIGMQYDGTSVAATLSGPVPVVVPSTPIVTDAPGGIKVGWDGKFTGFLDVAPMDFAGIDIVIGTDQGFDAIATPPTSRLSSARGGESYIALEPGTYWVALVLRTTAGKWSAPSVVTSGEALPVVAEVEPMPVPTESPDVAVTALGIMALQASWEEVENATTYEVYIDDAPITAPSDEIRLTSTPALAISIDRLPDGTELAAGTTYYVRIRAANPSGAATLGVEGSAQVRQAGVAEISSGYVYAGTVEANQIEAGNLEAQLALVGGITAGDPTGKRVEMTGADGFKVVDEAGQAIVHFPISVEQLNRFSGELVAQAFTAEGRTQFRGVDNEISTSSSFKLANGVTPPANAPQMSHHRNVRIMPGTSDDAPPSPIAFDPLSTGQGSSIPGLWYDSATNSLSAWCAPSGETGGWSLEDLAVKTWDLDSDAVTERLMTRSVIQGEYWRYNTAGGPGNSTTDFFAEGKTALYGLVSLDGQWITIERRMQDGVTPQLFIVRYSIATGAQTGAVNITSLMYPTHEQGSGASVFLGTRNAPAVGLKGGNLIILQQNETIQKPRVIEVNPTTGALVSTVTLDMTLPGIPLTNVWHAFSGISYGNFDLGSPHYFMTRAGASDVYTYAFNASGGRVPVRDFESLGISGDTTASPPVWNGTRFLSPSRYVEYRLYEHSTETTSNLNPYWGGYTWYDSNTSGTGTHETTLSPIASIVPKPRWGVRMDAPVSPPGNPEDDEDAPTEWRGYMARAENFPGTSAMALQPSTWLELYNTGLFIQHAFVVNPLATGVAPPVTNTFPDGNAAIIESAAGGFIVRGDGTGAWPFLTDSIDDRIQAAEDAVEASSSQVGQLKVRMASTANVVLSGWGYASIDAVFPSIGDVALLKNQTNAAQNGVYTLTYDGVNYNWVRMPGLADSVQKLQGVRVYVREGSTQNNTFWHAPYLTHTATLGSTSISYVKVEAHARVDWNGSSYPARPLWATHVTWVGPTAPAFSATQAITGLDQWISST